MKRVMLFLCALGLLPLQQGVKASTMAPVSESGAGQEHTALGEAEAAYQQVLAQYTAGFAPEWEVMEAQRELLACRIAAGVQTPDEQQAQYDALNRRHEEYLQRRMAAGETDMLRMNDERIEMQRVQLALLRRAGRPTKAARARLRSLYEANLTLQEHRFRRGFATEAEVEVARRRLEEFLKEPS